MCLKKKQIIGHFYWILILSLSSCHSKRTENKSKAYINYNSFHVDIKQLKELTEIKDVIDYIKFIPLETKDSSVIAEIEKVVFSNNKYYILDKKFQSLKIFDKAGKYIRSIGRIGDGPGEYKELEDFIVDTNTNHILLLDNGKRSIHEFDKDGRYLKSVKNNLFANYFNIIGDTYYYHIGQNISPLSKNYHLILINRLGKIIKRMFSFPPVFNYGAFSTGCLIPNRNGMLYNSALNDTIFQITPDHIYPKYIFDFGSNKIPPEVQYSVKRFMKEGLSYSFLTSHIEESDNILMFSYRQKTEKVYAFCRINNNEGESEDIKKNIIPYSVSFPIGAPLGITANEEFISSISVPRLLAVLNHKSKLSDEVKNKYADLYNLLPSLTKSANPILVTFKFKDDM